VDKHHRLFSPVVEFLNMNLFMVYIDYWHS
jgi:hypothetical protein